MRRNYRICFVCLGNIVRSPLAKALFERLTERAGVKNHYQVASAGTSHWHVGEPPDPRMQRVAARHGLIYDGRAYQFQRGDFDKYDLILALDRENHNDLQAQISDLKHQAKVRLLREFDPMAENNPSVPDPYYGSLDGFEEVYQIIERSCQGLLDALEADQEEQDKV